MSLLIWIEILYWLKQAIYISNIIILIMLAFVKISLVIFLPCRSIWRRSPSYLALCVCMFLGYLTVDYVGQKFPSWYHIRCQDFELIDEVWYFCPADRSLQFDVIIVICYDHDNLFKDKKEGLFVEVWVHVHDLIIFLESHCYL